MDDDLKGIEEYIEWLIEQGSSLDEIQEKGKFIADQKLFKRAIENKRSEIDDIIHIPFPLAFSEDEPEGWVRRPKMDSDLFWPKFRELLKIRKDFPEEVIKSIDSCTDKILSYLENPNKSKFNIKGLVVGYVQSGKTANYTGLIAKAADRGYKMFVILTSSNNKLRKQTQLRIEQDLIDSNKSYWFPLTTIEHDLGVNIPNPDAYLSLENDDRGRKISDNYRTICVIKKNTNRLMNLINWFRRATPNILKITPILIIDDEADNASINTRFRDDRTTINREIIDIIQGLNKVSYIGYTATPFANILIDPNYDEDLYPRNFIVDLPKPDNYFGAEKIFGREKLVYDDSDFNLEEGLDMIREVPLEEILDLKPKNRSEINSFTPKITKSLERAIRYFWLATAARFSRGQSQKHSTMLIHTTSFSIPQNKFRNPLIEFREVCFKALLNPLTKEEEFRNMKSIWEEEQEKLDASLMEPPKIPVSFDELQLYLTDVIRNCDIFIENSTVDQKDRMVYGEDQGIYIVVGGNILSRGLTLDGLVVSFFIRGASAYDTLLQMGRWFGYRIGYEDLPRIWMTNELRGFFSDLAVVEEEIRYDIQRYVKEKITPREYGVRIRTHPNLLITSRMKMRAGIRCNISYSETRVQTTIFKKKDRTWLRGNLNATRRLFKDIGRNPNHGETSINQYSWIVKDVDVKHIINYINNYEIHENHIQLSKELLLGYIKEENNYNSLKKWNIAVLSRKTTNIYNKELGTIDLGFPNKQMVNSINRSEALSVGISDTNLKSIMVRDDTILDFENIEGVIREGPNRDNFFKLRSAREPNIGLLILYPISKDSIKPPNAKANVDLKAIDNIIGLGLVFPKSKINRPKDYIVANIPQVEIEDEFIEVIDDE